MIGALLTPQMVAERWGVSSTFVYTMLNTGELPGFKLGGKLWRVKSSDMEAYECRLSSN